MALQLIIDTFNIKQRYGINMIDEKTIIIKPPPPRVYKIPGRWAIKNSIYSKAAKYIRGKLRSGVVTGVVWFFFASIARKSVIINIHVATTVKRCRKAHYYYLQKEKHQRRFSPSIKDNFQTLVRAQKERGVFLPGNKSTRIKTKRMRKRGQDEKAPGRQVLRSFFSPYKWREGENNIILYCFYYKNNQDYTEWNELMWKKCMYSDFYYNTREQF